MTMEYRFRVQDSGNPWHEVKLEDMVGNEQLHEDVMLSILCEGFVVGMADEYQWSDGDIVTIEAVAPSGKEIVIDLALRQQWHAEIVGAA
jgi:hypothetical protein